MGSPAAFVAQVGCLGLAEDSHSCLMVASAVAAADYCTFELKDSVASFVRHYSESLAAVVILLASFVA